MNAALEDAVERRYNDITGVTADNLALEAAAARTRNSGSNVMQDVMQALCSRGTRTNGNTGGADITAIVFDDGGNHDD